MDWDPRKLCNEPFYIWNDFPFRYSILQPTEDLRYFECTIRYGNYWKIIEPLSAREVPYAVFRKNTNFSKKYCTTLIHQHLLFCVHKGIHKFILVPEKFSLEDYGANVRTRRRLQSRPGNKRGWNRWKKYNQEQTLERLASWGQTTKEK